MTDRFPDFLNPAVDASGNAISGARLFFYRVGTSAKKDTYSNSAKTVLNANPVVADSGGRFGDIFMLTDEQYKVILAPAGVDDPPTSPIKTWDNVSPVLQPGTFPVLSVITKSANFTVLTTERGATFLVDASSGPVTATLPAVATAASGFAVRFKKTDSSANLVTIDGDGAETIDNLTTVALGLQNDALTITGDATQWNIEAEKRLPTPVVGIADNRVVVNSAGTGFTTAPVGLPRGHLVGLALSNGTDATNDIDIAEGEARDDANNADLVLASAVGKQLDVSWSAGGTPGTPTGGLSSSLTLTNDTWYHAILGLVSGTVEVGFDTSITGANLVTDHSFTNTRRIGSVRRGTATNLAFSQRGDHFLWDVPIQDVNENPAATTAQLKTLTTPLGYKALALTAAKALCTAGNHVLFQDPDLTDTAASATAYTFTNSGSAGTTAQSAPVSIWTNASSQIQYRVDNSTQVTDIEINTLGWVDRRGRDD